MTKDISIKMNEKKMDLINIRLKELGFDIDIRKEIESKNPRVFGVQKDNNHILYMKDGSETGLRIITFVHDLDMSKIDYK